MLADPRRYRREISAPGKALRLALWLTLPVAFWLTFAGDLKAQTFDSGVKLWGEPVLDIRLRCDASLSLADFPGVVTQEPGQPLDPSKVSESLKRLYATGRFAELSAEGEPGPGGVHLVFVARAQYFVGVVQVGGTPSSMEPRILLTSTRLRLGQPVSDEILAAAERHISEALAANAYYRATVRYRLHPDPATLEAGVIYSIFAGKPARLSGVEFQGQPGFPIPKLAKVGLGEAFSADAEWQAPLFAQGLGAHPHPASG